MVGFFQDSLISVMHPLSHSRQSGGPAWGVAISSHYCWTMAMLGDLDGAAVVMSESDLRNVMQLVVSEVEDHPPSCPNLSSPNRKPMRTASPTFPTHQLSVYLQNHGAFPPLPFDLLHLLLSSLDLLRLQDLIRQPNPRTNFELLRNLYRRLISCRSTAHRQLFGTTWSWDVWTWIGTFVCVMT